ncbi:hypothetical protein Pfo_021244 [Paulownia fortunei]|nr:hypothetical protein Pfo_021244 [Paulownia fortunei]
MRIHLPGTFVFHGHAGPLSFLGGSFVVLLKFTSASSRPSSSVSECLFLFSNFYLFFHREHLNLILKYQQMRPSCCHLEQIFFVSLLQYAHEEQLNHYSCALHPQVSSSTHCQLWFLAICQFILDIIRIPTLHFDNMRTFLLKKGMTRRARYCSWILN